MASTFPVEEEDSQHTIEHIGGRHCDKEDVDEEGLTSTQPVKTGDEISYTEGTIIHITC